MASFIKIYNYNNQLGYTYDGSLIIFEDDHAILIGPAYSTANPTIIANLGFPADSLTSFAVIKTVTPPDALQYTVNIDGIDYWWDGGAWAVSDGTYAKSNSESVINTNIGTLAFTAGSRVVPKVFLHSDAGTSTPLIERIVFMGQLAEASNLCIVYGRILDSKNNPVNGVRIVWEPYDQDHFLSNSVVGEQETVESLTNPQGYWEAKVFETATTGQRYKVTFIYPQQNPPDVVLTDIEVPDQAVVKFSDIAPGTPPAVSGSIPSIGLSADKGIVTWDGVGGDTLQSEAPRFFPSSAGAGPAGAGEGDLWYSEDIGLLMQYTGAKWLSVAVLKESFSRSGTTAIGSPLTAPGGLNYNVARGVHVQNDGTLVGFGYTRSDSDASVFAVAANGSEVATIASSAVKGTTPLDVDFSAGDILGALVSSTAANAVDNVHGWFEYRWRK